MNEHKDKNEFEINKAVAKLRGYLVQDINDDSMIGMNSKFREQYPRTVWVAEKDPITGEQTSAWEQKCFTRIADDAWPIIADNKISICFGSELAAAKAFTATKLIEEVDENPLMAAMIVFLIIQE